MADKMSPEEIMGMKSNSNAIVIHVSQLGASLVPKLIMECNNADYWHKFVIGNVESYERDFILKTVMDFVSPADLIPVNFVKKKRAFFLARNCLDAILKLTRSKLVIPNPLHPKTPLRLVIIANHYPAQQLKFDFEENVVTVLKKRFNPQMKSLNLKEFHKDDALNEFFLLSQPKLLLYVIQFAVELEPTKIDLSNNFLKKIGPLRLLSVCKINSIDLRNNEISRMEDLEPLNDFKELKILKLDGNPICREWDSFSYIRKLKEICPTLEVIDDSSLLPKKTWCPTVHKNSLCSSAGGDLTAQFLEHFFMRYDSESRQKLAPLYHENAMFSVTYRIIPGQKSCQNIQLNHYRAIDRNSKGVQGPRPQFLFQGRKAIMKVFANFPRTNHDPMEFKCDLVYYTGRLGIVVVNGVFREDKRYIGFTRNFVLRLEENAYRITNDQLHVYNALDFEMKNSDCYPLRVEMTGIPLPFYADQFIELQEAVHKITNLNYDYSQRYLDACHYDLKKTLEYFVDMHLKDEVPKEAFIQIGQKGLLSMKNPNAANLQYPNNIKMKTLTKHPVVAPRTVWQTLKDDRLSAEYLANSDKETQEAERERVKKKILTAAPSNSDLDLTPNYRIKNSLKSQAKKMAAAAETNNNSTAAPVISKPQQTINMVSDAKTNNNAAVAPVMSKPQETIVKTTKNINPIIMTRGMSRSQRKKANRCKRLQEMYQHQYQYQPKASNRKSRKAILKKDLSTPGLTPIPFVPAVSTAVLPQSQNLVTNSDVQMENSIQEPAASFENQLQLENPKETTTSDSFVEGRCRATISKFRDSAVPSQGPEDLFSEPRHCDQPGSTEEARAQEHTWIVEQLRATPRPCTWSPELWRRIQALRPTGDDPNLPRRCRLFPRTGGPRRIRVPPNLCPDLSTPDLTPIPLVPAASTALLTQSQNTVTNTDVQIGNSIQAPAASHGNQLQVENLEDLSTPDLTPIPLVPAASTVVLTQSQNTVTNSDVQIENSIQEPAASHGNQLQLENPKDLSTPDLTPIPLVPAASTAVLTQSQNTVTITDVQIGNSIQEPPASHGNQLQLENLEGSRGPVNFGGVSSSLQEILSAAPPEEVPDLGNSRIWVPPASTNPEAIPIVKQDLIPAESERKSKIVCVDVPDNPPHMGNPSQLSFTERLRKNGSWRFWDDALAWDMQALRPATVPLSDAFRVALLHNGKRQKSRYLVPPVSALSARSKTIQISQQNSVPAELTPEKPANSTVVHPEDMPSAPPNEVPDLGNSRIWVPPASTNPEAIPIVKQDLIPAESERKSKIVCIDVPDNPPHMGNPSQLSFTERLRKNASWRFWDDALAWDMQALRPATVPLSDAFRVALLHNGKRRKSRYLVPPVSALSARSKTIQISQQNSVPAELTPEKPANSTVVHPEDMPSAPSEKEPDLGHPPKT